MPVQTTLINTTHDLITVPAGLVDDFARDDGWPGDRPASCGNFWNDHFGAAAPLYLSSGKVTVTPGVTLGFGSLYLGGSAQTFQIDIDGGASSSTEWFCDFLTNATDTGTSANRFRLEALSTGAYLTYLDGSGTETILASYGTGLNTGLYRWYITAVPLTGGTYLKIARSLTDGSSYTVLSDMTVGQTLTGSYIAVGLEAGETADNITRLADPTIVFDNFNRADASTLGSPWVAQAGTWGISSNRAVLVTASGDNQSTVVRDDGLADCTVSATMATVVNSGSGHGLCMRATDNNNHLLIEPLGSGNVIVYKRVAGTYTSLGSASAPSWVSGDTISVTLSGSSITVKHNGTTVLTVTSTFNQTATKHGLRANTNGSLLVVPGTSAWDNFTVI